MTKTDVAFSSVITQYAASRNIDTTRAGKAIRGKLRAMGDDALCEIWPAFKASGKKVRDGNRYPTSLPVTLSEQLLAGRAAVTA